VLVLVGCGRANFDELGDAAIDVSIDAPADPSLRLYFTFDTPDLLADSSGYHHDGTCTSCPMSMGGRVGAGAAAFSPGECIHIADAADLRPAAFTLAAWANAAGEQNGTAFWRAYNGATTVNDSFGIGFNTSLNGWDVNVGGTGINASGTPVGWHHYAVSFDGSTFVAYFDGATFGAPTAAGAPYANDELTIGCQIDIGVEVFQLSGSVDEVRFYDRALPAGEISGLFNM